MQLFWLSIAEFQVKWYLFKTHLAKPKRGQKLLAVALNFLLDSLNFENSEYRETTTSALVIYRITVKGGQVTISDKCHKGSRNNPKPIWWRNGPFTWIANKNAYLSQPQLSMFSTPFPRSKFRHPAEATSAYLATGLSSSVCFSLELLCGAFCFFFGGVQSEKFQKAYYY